MNAVQMMNRIDYYNDFTRSARFSYAQYGEAVNGVILTYIDQQLGFGEGEQKNTYQFIQKIRDKLYTLVKTATPSITNGTVITGRYGSATPSHINFPTDYQNFVGLNVLIDSYTDYSRPTDYNKIGPLLDNSFMKPSNQKTYYNEDATGLTIWRGVGGTFTTATLTYLKAPATFSLGSEDNWIYAGVGVLTLSASYIAIDDSVHNGTTYLSGTQFIATVTTNLTTGKVILASLTTPCDLPEQTHDTICKMVSEMMLGVTSNFNGSQFVEKEVSKNN
jgi:hypothetical protein